MAAAVLVLVAVAARIHNAFAYPPLRDFDAAPHALYVYSLYTGALPDPRTWAGFHPPLYYAAGALLWRVLPEAVPVHTALRLLSAAAGFGAVAIAWRALHRVVDRADAAVVAAFVTCVPVFAIATSSSATRPAARCSRRPRSRGCSRFPRRRAPRSDTRSERGCSRRARRSRRAPASAPSGCRRGLRRQLRSAGAGALARLALPLVVLPALLVAPHYGRLVAATGSPLAVISGGTPSDVAGSEMAAQPPGERHLVDYVRVPTATFVAPIANAPGMFHSVPGLLWASTFADGHAQFLPVSSAAVMTAAALGSLSGLLPAGLAIVGLLAIARSRKARAVCAGPLLYGALLLAAFLVQTWAVPRFSAVKASYLLSALLPAALALGFGLATRGRTTRLVLRGALLALGAGYAALTWYGWWT